MEERDFYLPTSTKSNMKITRNGVRHGPLQSVFLEPILEVGLGRVVATSDKLLGGAKDWLFVFHWHKASLP